MHVRVITDECEIQVSALTKKKYPKGWTGEMPDELAVEAILTGHAEDPTGELTREALAAEIERRQAIIDAGGDPDAPENQPQAEPDRKPRRSGGRKSRATAT